MRLGLKLCNLAVVFMIHHGTLLAEESVSRFELGTQFTYMHLQLGVVENQAGFGAKLGINLHRRFAFDSELNFFPVRPKSASSFDGGRIVQGLFGLKAGLRRDKFGVFARVRPGFISFGHVITSLSPPPDFTFTIGRLTEKCLDFGGVAELYVNRRMAVRYDLGDTVVFYAPRPIFTGASISQGFTAHDFQFSSGIVFRF